MESDSINFDKFVEFMRNLMIERTYQPLEEQLQKGRVLIIYGPRRIGKTTLLHRFMETTSMKFKFDSGDNLRVQQQLSAPDFEKIKEYCLGYDIVLLDEAQNIPNIGQTLKIMIDEIPDLFVVATGSSSFDLSNRVGEPLVGRQRILKLFPISLLELSATSNKLELDQRLEEFLIYGLYPEILTESDKSKKVEFLLEMVESYLLKDILSLENIKSPRLLLNLVRMLAFQVGSEVSMNELSNGLGVDVKTVGRYLDLLEKSFVILSTGGYSRNLRNEITSKKKYYFFDVGIRNAIINSFNPLSTRNDIGLLWENFLVLERLKTKTYKRIYSNDYFWRTYSKNEIDLVEERDGKLFGYEFKWKQQPAKAPREWAENYPESSFEVITRDNYLSFIL